MIGRGDRQGACPPAFRIDAAAVRGTDPIFFLHPLPAPHIIGTFVGKTDISYGSPPIRLVRGLPLVHLFAAMGTGIYCVAHNLLQDKK